MRASKTFNKCCLLVILIMLAAAGSTGQVIAQSTVDLVVHYIEGAPAAQDVAYDVNVYLSVVDSAGNPIKDMTADSFTVTEDSQKVDIADLALVTDDPVNVVLVMDTSGSMGGTGINSAKTAASNFVTGLGAEDRVAAITFDNTIKTLIDFTTDHKAARDQIALVDVVRGSGTCLYDAAYQAIQMASTLPSGRRAVILFTDGVDETSNHGICSSHTADDVIDIASEGGTRTPVYTLGMGTRIDANNLKRLAEMTGGRTLYSPDPSQLDAMFLRLADQLRSQYKLTYKSVSGPGAHSLAVSASYLKATDSDTRNFLLPAMPTRLSFISPPEGSKVSGVTTIGVTLSGQGETVGKVAFEINNEAVGTDDTTPYELDVDLSTYSPGDLTVTAIAYGTTGTELTRKAITVTLGAGEAAAATPEPTVTPTPKVNTGVIVGGGIGLLVLITAGIITFIVLRRKRHEKELDDAWAKAQSNDLPSTSSSMDERTFDGWEASPDALGLLIITASDDATMIGHRFEITKTLVTMGRSADNDVNFPKDSPVSRHHAQIAEKNGGLYFSEIQSADSSGVSKPPTYGTFLNDTEMGPDPVLLQSGDEIRLGKRVRLKFEAAGRVKDTDSVTYDGLLSQDDDDRTREM
jgi:VWFA-related protein